MTYIEFCQWLEDQEQSLVSNTASAKRKDKIKTVFYEIRTKAAALIAKNTNRTCLCCSCNNKP